MIPLLGGLAFVGAFVALFRSVGDAKDVLPRAHQCSWCQRAYSDTDLWLIQNGAEVSHGICPSCQRQHFPELAEDK